MATLVLVSFKAQIMPTFIRRYLWHHEKAASSAGLGDLEKGMRYEGEKKRSFHVQNQFLNTQIRRKGEFLHYDKKPYMKSSHGHQIQW
jgi:hypothetical protein